MTFRTSTSFFHFDYFMNTIVIILIDLAVFLSNSFNSFRNDESMLLIKGNLIPKKAK